MKKTKSGLWTKDFTILTVGSLVSMLGNSLICFAMCLLVLDQQNSPLSYAIFVGSYTLPQVIVPIFSGAILDRYSRRRTIYTLDFISTALFIFAVIILEKGWFSFTLLAIYCFIMGTSHSIYIVAYQSFYPLLVKEENFSKAYSVSSFLETLSAVMVPVATLLYKTIGIEPLLWINIGCFFFAAVMETQIKADEHYIELQHKTKTTSKTSKQIIEDIGEGFRYLYSEKGLLLIGIYFTIQMLVAGSSTVIALPYFKANFQPNGEYLFIIVVGSLVVGKAIGGLANYHIRWPAEKKYKIAVIACVIAAILQAFYLFAPVPLAMLMCFVAGLFDNTNYTIRSAATQSYVPDHKKGRFNGAYNMLSTTGTLAGQLIAGCMASIFPSRIVLMTLMLLNGVGAVLILGINKKKIKPIYNI